MSDATIPPPLSPPSCPAQGERRDPDRDLLLGVLALQLNFISHPDLKQALKEWGADHSRPLGQVLVAPDEEINREVALKEIQDPYAHHPDSRARFLLEAEITGGLEHPGIVPVYGLGRHADGRPYYAMRFIRGESLYEAINRF